MAIADLLAVAAISVTYVAFEALHVAKRWSFLTVGIAVAFYAAILIRRRTDSWADLGFRVDNLRSALIPFGGMTLVLALCLVAWAAATGKARWNPEIFILLALYPVWALIQQAVFQGLLHRRLMILFRSAAVQVLCASAAFAMVHIGNFSLALMTFVAGILWSLLYRKWPNLWLLAASHTILAGLVYPLVLGDRPLLRL
jgi:hypothetical protein